MSFQSKGLWMAKGPGCLNDGEISYDNSSRIEPKRAHQWFVDPTEPELFPNKKQAMDASNSKPISGISNVNFSPWENVSSFQSVSGQFSDRLFGSEPERTINFGVNNIPSVNTGHLNMGRKVFEDQFGNDPSVGLSISHTMEDPASCLSYGGIRKVKINQVKDSDNGISVSMGHIYNRGDNNMISMSQTYDKRDGNMMSMGHAYDKRDDNTISIGHTQAYDRRDDNTISMGHAYNKGDNNTISMSHTYNKGDENTISMSQTYNKADENTISMGHIYNKGDDSTMTMGHIFNKGDSNIISMGHPYNKGESTTISFTGFHLEPETNPSGRLISSYDLLMGQSSVQTSEPIGEKELVDASVDVLANNSQIASAGTEAVPKNKMELKMSKKVAPNNFPSNVKSLLSTGMLDGVPVKYISWSREKELRGVIKGSGYLCSCQTCNYSKVLNAYEFERHAGCKTKHPNNHIFFDNGKTIYGIVQELRSTPQNMLFDAIQTVTGSPINQKSFRVWKASFEAATRELQRIFGKDEAQQSQSEVF
ncbi:PREDICTED: uncharacterized protein LOC104599288 [Nelumbo nucifera]|uniref:Tify domain-containing protein n=2 Tax=Nelumbo nucifera TaxID=4432 RepID=A0A822Y8E7_NELNU|nr:PREDICTED: uncharacterized protein LOC104599288 [Nelumbo nucifera]DAD27841.1 TPA_asm: hypothetical protein HUJ06_029309 [Nelumbo nucifera]